MIYAKPRTGLTLADCYFYHVMDLPGHGLTPGEWDLRAGVEAYLGGFDFRGKRVLEIGPASGFLTIEMETRGAQVVAVEVTDEHDWDYVPFPPDVLDPIRGPRRRSMNAMKNSWWLVRELHHSSAQVYYGDAGALPDELGEFDVAVLGAVLTHCRSPVSILEQCARRAKAVIIVEPHHPGLSGRALCELNPSRENRDYGTWWHFSPQFFSQFLGVMGFDAEPPTGHFQLYRDVQAPMFTLIARRQA